MLNVQVGLELIEKGVLGRRRMKAGWFNAFASSIASRTLEGKRYSSGGLNMPIMPSNKQTQDLVNSHVTVASEAHEYHLPRPTLHSHVFVKRSLSWWIADHYREIPVCSEGHSRLYIKRDEEL